MSTISITKTYDDGSLLSETDLDPFISGSQTFVNTTKLNDDNIANSGITASTKLKDGTVTTAKLAASSVTESALATSSVTSAKITDANITTAKITDSSVTTAKINDSAVTTGKLAASSVTSVKCTANWAVATIPATSSAGSGERTITVAQVTITGNSRPVILTASCPISITLTGSNSGATVSFCKGDTSTSIANFTLQSSPTNAAANLLGSMAFLDSTGGSGSTTYYLVISTTTNTSTVTYGHNANDDSYFWAQEI